MHIRSPFSISHATTHASWFASIAILALSACGGSKDDGSMQEGNTTTATTATTATSSGAGGDNVIMSSGSAGTFTVPPTATGGDTSGSTGTGAGGGAMVTLPADKWVMTEVGGYQLGPAVSGAGVTDTGLGAGVGGCNTMVGVVRDFKGQNEMNGHPDFESYNWASSPSTGLVSANLGADGKPVYSSKCGTMFDKAACPAGSQTSTKEAFDQWYRFSEGVNKPYLIYFMLSPNGKLSTFDSKFFFPVDDQGFGASGTGDDSKTHNFGFTTELHTNFTYNGGETFTFIGDDDLWVFINGKLAIDLGGVHPSLTGSVDLDARARALGMTKGQVYRLELFHAERHTSASHFHIDTTLAFVDCGVIPPDIN